MATNNAWNSQNPAQVALGGTGASTLTGVLIGNGTSAVTGNAVTQHDVLVGGASNAITSVAPSATSGVPLVSGGASADPSFTTAVVAGGGTGVTSTTAYAVLCGGTTSTAALQSIASVGTSGQILTSNGAGALPTFQAAASVGASWVKLSSQTASSSASITFNNTLITNTYNVYAVILSNILSATAGTTFHLDMSTDNGSTYLNSNYQSGCTSMPFNSTTLTNSNSSSTVLLTTTGAMSSTNPYSGIAYIYGLAATGNFQSTYSQAQSGGGNISLGQGFQFAGGLNVNNIRFIMASGNIASGTLTLYGIVT